MIESERLILRGWRDADRPILHGYSTDPGVMEFLGPPQTRAEVDAAIDRQIALLETIGHCIWAIERKDDGAFLGFCGLKPGPAGTPIAQDIEIGWRLGYPHWGRGYALEAAQASLDWGWDNLTVPEIAAITVADNVRSWGLMERLGMRRSPAEDFDHPGAADWLKPHITYRISRPKLG